ncbi:hypothetical protein OH77DRAFT_1421314 [Trametes cingulata]|nr:hypothetical protein OH77DRAFT_1421314 [Trametes cingulata]
MDAPPRDEHRQKRTALLQPRTPPMIGRPRQRGGASTVPLSFRSASYREERAAMRLERYGGEKEKLNEKQRAKTPVTRNEDVDEMDYSDTHGTPTPAQAKTRDEDEPRGEGSECETGEESEEEGPCRATPDEGTSRSRKRPRVASPTEEDPDESWTQPRLIGATGTGEAAEEGDEEGRMGEREEHRQTDAPRNALDNAKTATEAPPPYPTLPSAEDCEAMIERVVQQATTSLRTELRKLVDQARGQNAKETPTQQPPLSQETLDYWQYYEDPTAALLGDEFERALEAAGASQWTAQPEAPPPRASLFAFPDIKYDDMEVLLAKCTERAAPLASAPPQHRHESMALPRPPQASETSDPRARAAKGKERQRNDAQVPMDIDRTLAQSATAERASDRRPQASWAETVVGPALRQETDREKAEERRLEELRRRWDEARLADPIADREASGQPEHRRKVDEEDLAMARALQRDRAKEIEKLGLAPPSENGYPAVHANSPRDRVRNIPESKLREWRLETPGTYVLLDVYGEGDIEDTDPQRIYDDLQAALMKITGLGRVKLEQPPRTPKTVSKEHATTVWFASGLYPAAVALLVTVHAWPTANITFFAYKETEFIPRYLFAIKGFTQNDQNEVRLAVWELFHKSPILPSIQNLIMKNPDYVGMDHYEVTNAILSTIEVSIRPVNEEKHARLITHVYMTTPTRSAAMWESWRDGLRYPPKGKPLSEDHAHLEVSQRITHCKACHGADHLTTQCPYGHLEGWAKVTEGAGPRKTDQWRTRTPRPGNSQYAGERGGAISEDENGGAGWTYAEGRAKGARTRGLRGGGPTRGGQPKPRRN